MADEDDVDEAPAPGIAALGGSRGPYQWLPPLTPQELTQLEDSIRQRGVEDPIAVDEAGRTLDGYHRRAIADRLGVESATRVITGLSEDEKNLFVIRRNTERRQLTKAQRALVGLRAEPSFRVAAQARQGARTDLSPDLAKSQHIWTAEEAARKSCGSTS
jgi:ParB-like chromosome segregation protein Spo0J